MAVSLNRRRHFSFGGSIVVLLAWLGVVRFRVSKFYCLVLTVVLPFLLLPTKFAYAHHPANQGGPDGLAAIRSLGPDGGRALSRILVMNEFMTGRQPDQTGYQLYQMSLTGEYAPIREFSMGLQLPIQGLIEEENESFGLGDIQLFLQYTPRKKRNPERVWSFALNSRLPTHSIQSSFDIGRSWSIAPSGMFTWSYRYFYWQALLSTMFESRPAGMAYDGMFGAQVGVALFQRKLTLGAGSMNAIRIFNVCTEVDGSQAFCQRNRVTEIEREPGSFRSLMLVNLSYNYRSWGAIQALLRVPVTRKRDFDVAVGLGAQFMF